MENKEVTIEKINQALKHMEDKGHKDCISFDDINHFELIDGNECSLIYTYRCKVCGELYRYSYAFDDINLPHVCK